MSRAIPFQGKTEALFPRPLHRFATAWFLVSGQVWIKLNPENNGKYITVEMEKFSMSESEKQVNLSSSDMPSIVIDAFRRRIRGVRICALEVIPKAKDVRRETVASSHAALERCAAQLPSTRSLRLRFVK